MARVTVEDCLGKVDNRFELVLLATKRARQLSRGKEPMVEWENDKATVVALREIAEDKVDSSLLDEPAEQEENAASAISEEEVKMEVTQTAEEAAPVAASAPAEDGNE